MICPKCQSETQSMVLYSKEKGDVVYRRRKCLACGYKYVTEEKFLKRVRRYQKTPADSADDN